MTLVLRGITLDEEPMSQPLMGRFDERGGTLGRSDEATLTLPDPERLISRIQAQVLHPDGHYWLENISPASAVLHNGRPLSIGMRVVLTEGDEIKIGGYALQAAFEDAATSKTILRGRTVRDTHPPKEFQPPPAGAVPDVGESLVKPVRSSRATDTGPAAPGDSQSLWHAFLEGAGLEGAALPGTPTPQLLRSIGEMLKIAVGGLQHLITLRARAKLEMQGEMTLIAPRDNNPLKFSPDAELALKTLLQPPTRGFLDGPTALRDALTDLQSHQVGTRAGMRAVLEAVLDRLDPDNLATQQGRRSIFDFLWPARRRARLWETYLSQHRSLRETDATNLQRSFGKIFRDAYEAQGPDHEVSGDITKLRDGNVRPIPQAPQRR